MSRGKQIFSVFTGRLTFGTGVKMIMQLTNTAPFSMSGTTTGTKPCKRQTPTEVFPIWTPRKNQPTFILLSSFVLPFAVVCQGQSSEVQSEVGLLLLSGSRTCGLRHELAVFRGGGQICSGYHPHQHQPHVIQNHSVLRHLHYGAEQNISLGFWRSFRRNGHTSGTSFRNAQLEEHKTESSKYKCLRNELCVFKPCWTPRCTQRFMCC